jgi:lipopolysaccharide transport system ATP-binding protein
MSTAISIDHVSKGYRLGEIGGGTLSRDLSRWWARMRGKSDPFMKIGQDHQGRRMGEYFWALEDISFKVNQGDVLGIIGRNGAGKSTLLKVLSQVTSPTSGEIRVRGRIASLLEVGTGFHPELTGRENIYLNGAILGMTRAEIRRNFDEIVDFSECEDFIDTPVKRYSSGMYVRLAFAVAAHLDPEILIVDEVLAVGDAQFQKKCLGKMQDVGRQGRTVLFVSHTMAAITRLCTRAVLLGDGRVVKDGSVHEVVSAYLHHGRGTKAAREWPDVSTAPGNDIVRLAAVRVRTADGEITDNVDISVRVGIEIEYEVQQEGTVLVPNIHVYNGEGVCVFIAQDLDPAWHRLPRARGRYLSTAYIPGNFLAEGSFTVGVAVSTLVPVIVHAWEPDTVAFEVVDRTDGTTARGDFAGPMAGVTRPMLHWTTSVVSVGEQVRALAPAPVAK